MKWNRYSYHPINKLSVAWNCEDESDSETDTDNPGSFLIFYLTLSSLLTLHSSSKEIRQVAAGWRSIKSNQGQNINFMKSFILPS